MEKGQENEQPKSEISICYFSETRESFKQIILAYHIPSRMNSQQHNEESIEVR